MSPPHIDALLMIHQHEKGRPPEFQVPIFVLTHHVPETRAKGENERLRFTFVTDGIDRAIAQAKAAAGDKDVVVIGGA
jgi:dihydrofolate reductase